MRGPGLVIAALVVIGCATRAGGPPAPDAGASPFVAGPIAAAATFANPIDIDYRFALDTPSRRDIADPVIVSVGDRYYLFASRSGGYWQSQDLRDWSAVVPDGLPLDANGATLFALDGRLYYTADGVMALYASDDPAGGKWHKEAPLARYDHAAILADDDGRIYLYDRSAADEMVTVVELDPRHDFSVIGAPQAVTPSPSGLERTSITKSNGRYYLELTSAPSGGRPTARIFASRSATTGFAELPNGSGEVPAGGFIGGGGASSLFRDRAGRLWRVATMAISSGARAERRLGIFAAGFDSSGVARTNSWLGDYPQLVPGAAPDPLERNLAGWMLLSTGKTATASSSLTGHPPALAFDDDAATWWSAKSSGVGEWLSVDLGTIARVNALQINFAEQDAYAVGRDDDSYEQYVVESSVDGAHWTTRIDASTSTRDAPHRYVQLDTARNARFVRITNVHAAAGGKFAIRELRIFGKSQVAPPSAVSTFVMTRSAGVATVTWTRVPRATAYVVRYGSAPDKLYSNVEVGDTSAAVIDAPDPAPSWWYTVDAIGEGGVARGTMKKKG